MNQAFAHAQIYPHLHPHAYTSPILDLILSLLWIGGVALFALLLIRVTRQLIQSRNDKSVSPRNTD